MHAEEIGDLTNRIGTGRISFLYSHIALLISLDDHAERRRRPIFAREFTDTHDPIR